MLALATLALVMQPDSPIKIASLVGCATCYALLANHGTTTSSGAGSEEVCVG
jgi:hypothetical protein